MEQQQVKETLQHSTFNPDDRGDVIGDYVAAGFTLIEVSGKVPVNKAWQQSEYNMFASAEDFPGNYGVKLPADILVIDYDPRNDKTEGKRALKNLQEFLGNIAFDTYTVITGGNGLHVYLRKPPEIAVVNELYKEKKDKNSKVIEVLYPEFSGIEFKTLGRQVIGPLSKHPTTGKDYRIAYHKPSYIMDAPKELIDLIKKSDAVIGVDQSKTALNKYTDDEQSIIRFKNFLAEHAPAIEGDGGDTHTYKTACRGRDFGLSPEKVFETMWVFWNPRCNPPWDDKDLWIKVKSAFENNGDVQGKWNPQADFSPVPIPEGVPVLKFDRLAKSGEIKKTLHNTCLFFELPDCPIKGLLRYNLFTENIEFIGKAPWHSPQDYRTGWSDEDAIQIRFWLSSVKMYEINVNIVHEAALKVAMDNVYHPVLEYLDNLQWDGIPRINNWLVEYAGAVDNKYIRTVGEKTLLAGVARIYEPGIKFDHVLVLEGTQGIGKSTLVHTLGGKWFGDIILDPHSKDTIDALRGKWIVELSEMECTRREVNALKRFISCTSDTVRLAYARTSKEFPRKSIFIGTINPEMGRGYLKDSTGNRRFWPVEIEQVNFKTLKQDVDQLWAEAVHIWKQGKVNLWLDDKDVIALASTEAAKRYETDPWEEIIERYLDTLEKDWISTQEVLDGCLLVPHSKVDKVHKNRITTVMGRLGWVYTNKRIDGKQVRCFVKKIIPLEL